MGEVLIYDALQMVFFRTFRLSFYGSSSFFDKSRKSAGSSLLKLDLHMKARGFVGIMCFLGLTVFTTLFE